MTEIDIEDQSAARETSGKSRFEGTVELGGAVTGDMLSVLFGDGSNVNGRLHFQGAVQIDGTFTGAVTTNDALTVGEHASIQAEINCGSAVVKGDVTGNITARESVALHAGAHVKGDITSPALSVDRGAMFDGASRMQVAPAKGERPGR